MPTSSGLLIADSGPVIALAKLSLLEMPRRIFERVVVPDTVYRECIQDPGHPDSLVISNAVATGALEVLANPEWPSPIQKPRLDDGELAAISLALELKAVLLIDELRGRRVAQSFGIPVIGVCGLLLVFKRQGWLEALVPSLDFLSEHGYFVSLALRRQVLIDAGEL